MNSFLTMNLNALYSDNKGYNQHFAKQLLDYSPKARTEHIPVYETNVNDLTILYEDRFPLHSLDGAKAEAETLVEQHACYSKYSMNIVFGLGLGYVLKAMVKALRNKHSQAKVILFEPNWDILHFTLSNVGLMDDLNSENLIVFTTPESLWQYVETHLVQGDGMGMLMTPGHLQAFGKDLLYVVEKLKSHAENAVKNSRLLQNRSRLWTTEFLKNAPYLPEAHPLKFLKDRFNGKTAILCGAGPSLNDVLPHVHTIRDKVAIFCVTGAVKALEKHGVTPDFVIGMDYYGPEKHLADLDQPLKGSHIITGPSAQTLMWQESCKGRWAAALKFNEQYTDFLNIMFKEPSFEFHSGGTVAYFMLMISVELGFKRLILAGQDLALRGNQIYATGEEAVVQGDFLVAKELNNRSTGLVYVEDWDGNPIKTQDDYKHFKNHYDKISGRLQQVYPEFEVYNCSVGGARIEEMENLPIEDLLPRLELSEPLLVDDLMKQAEEEALDFLPIQDKAERLYEAFTQLKKHTEETIDAAEDAITALKKLKILKACSWTEASERYSEAFNHFSELLEATSFLEDTFYQQQLLVYQAYNEYAETEEEHRQNFEVDMKYLTLMVQLLSENILPPLELAIEQLEARYECIPDDQLTISINTQSW